MATTQDSTVLPSIHQALAEREILPEHHLVDMGYTSAQLIVSSQEEYEIDLALYVNGWCQQFTTFGQMKELQKSI